MRRRRCVRVKPLSNEENVTGEASNHGKTPEGLRELRKGLPGCFMWRLRA
jgi:hypothetical protein